MILFFSRLLLWACVLAGTTLLWVAFIDAGDEGFPLSLERNTSQLLAHLARK
jgi:hypothetical protein